MTDTLDDFLSHHGVIGMHWGRHLPGKGVNAGKSFVPLSKNTSPTGFFNRPHVAKALLLSSYGKKSSYTNARARKTRINAGRLRLAGVLTDVGAIATNLLASSPAFSDSTKAGIAVTGQILGNIGSTAWLAANITGAVGAHQENKARTAAILKQINRKG